MFKYIPTYTNISDWTRCQFFQTGGTREKCWVLNPEDSQRYFFKVSLKKENVDYQSEFWMEIIASKLGQSLGLKMLDYNIAKQKESIGCLSKNMCEDGYELVEVTRILSSETYNPGLKSDQVKYTFSFLLDALSSKQLDKHIKSFIEVLVFDTIIGNQDRHQDNWGFIKPTADNENVKRKVIFPWKKKRSTIVSSWNSAQFSPIYDSGSCLGRELTEKRIFEMLKEESQLDKYINRGKPELRWENTKISYYDLLQRLMEDPKVKQLTKNTIERLLDNYKSNLFHDIVVNIDKPLGDVDSKFRLSNDRKEFIIKLTNKRISLLRELL